MTTRDDDDATTTHTCVDCRETFTISPGQREFFEGRGLSLPKRCPECRRVRREEREQAPTR